MPAIFYEDSALTTEMARSVGSLQGDGSTTTFSVSEEPDAVRIYSSTKPNGELVSGWTYDSGTVTLPSAPATGETAVAIKNDSVRLFRNQKVVGSSAVEADRTFEQQVWVKAVDEDLENLTISVADWVSDAGLDPTQTYYLAPDNGGSPGTYGDAGASLNLGDLSNGSSTSFWVKCIVEQGTAKNNYRDPQLKANYTAYATN